LDLRWGLLLNLVVLRARRKSGKSGKLPLLLGVFLLVLLYAYQPFVDLFVFLLLLVLEYDSSIRRPVLPPCRLLAAAVTKTWEMTENLPPRKISPTGFSGFREREPDIC
jgi:hypothetical protein